jgi:predicted alpha/beta-hydrolase family hydrolase
MTPIRPKALTITLDGRHVSGILQMPPGAHACYVLAHGAGAGMSHPFMAGVADGLAERGVATLRYQFPYMEQQSRRPDAPQLAQATVAAANVSRGNSLIPGEIQGIFV